MKIAIVYDLSESGGVQTCVFSLIKGLNSKGIAPVVFWDKEPKQQLLEELNLKVEFSKLNFIFSSDFIKKCPNTLRYLLSPFNLINISEIPFSFDYVYSFTSNILIDDDRPHLLYLSGPPLVPQLESRSNKFKLAKKIYSYFIRPFYPAYEVQTNANYVINSEFISKMFNESFSRKLKVIYPSNQLNFSKKNLKTKRIYSTFFSRIVDYKRPEFILKLAKEFPEERFVIMGGLSVNRIKYFKNLITMSLGLNLKNIEFIPNATKNEVEDILCLSKFYLFPAVDEHFGITTVEAILSGCIPFVHDSGGQKEIVPFEELRFTDNQFLDKYRKMLLFEHEELETLSEKLIKHCELFSEAKYVDEMISFL
jgi:hypothetical protein